MLSPIKIAQPPQSTGRPVYELPGADQAEEGAVKRIATLSSSGSGRIVATMGGVVRIKRHTFGLTVASIFDDNAGVSNVVTASNLLPNPPSSFDHMLGYAEKREDVHDKWVLIRLDPSRKLQNIIQTPNGFGESFIPTKMASDPRPSCEVWILTRRGVITGQSSHVTNESWEVRLTNGGDLGPEDRGSWAIDASTREVLGIVINIAERRVILCQMVSIFQKMKDENCGVDEASFLPGWESPSREASSDDKTNEKTLSSHRRSYAYFLPFSKRLHFNSSYVKVTQPCIGKAGPEKLWPLGSDARGEWRRLEPQLNDIIGQAPAKSEYGPSPTVAIYGFTTGESEKKASPTILILSSSYKYAVRLQKAIDRSGVAALSRFKVKALDKPIRWEKESTSA